MAPSAQSYTAIQNHTHTYTVHAALHTHRAESIYKVTHTHTLSLLQLVKGTNSSVNGLISPPVQEEQPWSGEGRVWCLRAGQGPELLPQLAAWVLCRTVTESLALPCAPAQPSAALESTGVHGGASRRRPRQLCDEAPGSLGSPCAGREAGARSSLASSAHRAKAGGTAQAGKHLAEGDVPVPGSCDEADGGCSVTGDRVFHSEAKSQEPKVIVKAVPARGAFRHSLSCLQLKLGLGPAAAPAGWAPGLPAHYTALGSGNSDLACQGK